MEDQPRARAEDTPARRPNVDGCVSEDSKKPRKAGLQSADERARTSTGFYSHKNLNLARLPIPPHPRDVEEDSTTSLSNVESGDRRAEPSAWACPQMGCRTEPRNEGDQTSTAAASSAAASASASASGKTPRAAKTFCRISAAASRLSRRNCLAVSRPCPMRTSPQENQAPLF